MLSHFCHLVYCIGRCYCQSLLWQILLPTLMADVIAISVWWKLLPLVFVIYFITKVADVIAFKCVEDGKTTCYLQIILADVIAMVADGITNQGW